MRIKVEQGDITTFAVDVIVNAANEQMLGGGGVDGAIHDAAGDDLFEACLEFPEIRSRVRCPTGQVRITQAFELPAKFVIHTVGPVWRGGGNGERDLLAACYRKSIELAVCVGARSIAFPAISCGAYQFPPDEAAQISFETTKLALSGQPIEQVVFVAFGQEMFDRWSKTIRPT